MARSRVTRQFLFVEPCRRIIYGKAKISISFFFANVTRILVLRNEILRLQIQAVICIFLRIRILFVPYICVYAHACNAHHFNVEPSFVLVQEYSLCTNKNCQAKGCREITLENRKIVTRAPRIPNIYKQCSKLREFDRRILTTEGKRICLPVQQFPLLTTRRRHFRQPGGNLTETKKTR